MVCTWSWLLSGSIHRVLQDISKLWWQCCLCRWLGQHFSSHIIWHKTIVLLQECFIKRSRDGPTTVVVPLQQQTRGEGRWQISSNIEYAHTEWNQVQEETRGQLSYYFIQVGSNGLRPGLNWCEVWNPHSRFLRSRLDVQLNQSETSGKSCAHRPCWATMCCLGLQTQLGIISFPTSISYTTGWMRQGKSSGSLVK